MTNAHDYKVMLRSQLQDGDLTLRAVGPQDIESIRQWRNAQMDVLRQSTAISLEEQKSYFAEHIWPDKSSLNPRQILLAIEQHGELIGYGGLVHISWPYRRAEISFLLNPTLEQNHKVLRDIFSRYLMMIQGFAFEDIKLHRLTTETYEHRVLHIEILESVGFKLEGRLREHIIVDGKLRNSLLHASLANEWCDRRNSNSLLGVIVTSASRKVPLIRALKDATFRLTRNTQVIAGDIDPLSIARLEADDFWQMPRLSDETISDLIDGCRSRGISIVLPTRDGELEFWARHREAFSQAGIEVIVSSSESIARCRDKLAFASFGCDAGLPMIPASKSPDIFGDVPLVVKERYGSASRGLGLNMTLATALEHARDLEEPIFQPLVPGPEISIDGWVDKHGIVAGVVLRRRDRVVSGESQVTTTFTDTALEEQATQVLTALQLRGPVVMQAIVDEGKLHVIECNPRFGGASTAAIAVGLDSLYWSVAEALDELDSPVFKRVPSEVRQIRMPVDRVIHDPDF